MRKSGSQQKGIKDFRTKSLQISFILSKKFIRISGLPFPTEEALIDHSVLSADQFPTL